MKPTTRLVDAGRMSARRDMIARPARKRRGIRPWHTAGEGGSNTGETAADRTTGANGIETTSFVVVWGSFWPRFPPANPRLQGGRRFSNNAQNIGRSVWRGCGTRPPQRAIVRWRIAGEHWAASQKPSLTIPGRRHRGPRISSAVTGPSFERSPSRPCPSLRSRRMTCSCSTFSFDASALLAAAPVLPVCHRDSLAGTDSL